MLVYHKIMGLMVNIVVIGADKEYYIMHYTGRDRFIVGNKKARKAFNNYYRSIYLDMTPETHPGRFGVLRKTRVFCSNPFCCGNPRRQRGATKLTFQELKYLV